MSECKDDIEVQTEDADQKFERTYGVTRQFMVSKLETLPDNLEWNGAGIGYNLKTLVDAETEHAGRYYTTPYGLVSELARGWEHHSGEFGSPIVGYYDDDQVLWEGEQLELRLDLIQYLIQGIKDL